MDGDLHTLIYGNQSYLTDIQAWFQSPVLRQRVFFTANLKYFFIQMIHLNSFQAGPAGQQPRFGDERLDS